MPLPGLLSLFGRLDRPFLVPAKTASAAARSRGQGRPDGRRATRASLDGGEHGCTVSFAGTTLRTPRAWRATASSWLLAMGVLLASLPPAQAAEPARETAEVTTAIDEASRRFGLPVAWIRAVIATESGGDRRAVSVKGAMGLMQLMPGTWRDLRADLGLGVDPFDHRDNVIAGAAYLRRLLDRFGPRGFLAAYNAGPARYQAFLDGARGLPPETVTYVARVEARVVGAGVEQRVSHAELPRDWRAAGLFVANETAGEQRAAGSAGAALFVEIGQGGRP